MEGEIHGGACLAQHIQQFPAPNTAGMPCLGLTLHSDTPMTVAAIWLSSGLVTMGRSEGTPVTTSKGAATPSAAAVRLGSPLLPSCTRQGKSKSSLCQNGYQPCLASPARLISSFPWCQAKPCQVLLAGCPPPATFGSQANLETVGLSHSQIASDQLDLCSGRSHSPRAPEEYLCRHRLRAPPAS